MDFDMKDFEELKQDINLTRDQLEDLNKLRKTSKNSTRKNKTYIIALLQNTASIYTRVLTLPTML